MNARVTLLAAARRALESRDAARAATLYRQCAQAQPGDAEAWRGLAAALAAQRDHAGAFRACERWASLRPGSAEAALEAGRALLAAGETEGAAAWLRRAVSLEPGSAACRLELGRALTEAFQGRAAVDELLRAQDLDPGNPRVRSALGNALQSVGAYDEAAGHYRAALAARESVADRANLASCLHLAGDLAGGLAEADRALALDAAYPPAVAAKANLLDLAGRGAEALALAEGAVARGVVTPLLANVYARLARRAGRAAEGVRVLEGVLRGRHMAPQRSSMLFQLGALLEDLGEFDRAFEAYRSANALCPTAFDAGAHERAVRALLEAWSPGAFARLPRAPAAPDPPIFIVGMPRSGTTLVEQILAAHPGVFGGGELELCNRLVEALPARLGSARAYPGCVGELTAGQVEAMAREHAAALAALPGRRENAGAARVTDKMPHNFRHVGLIRLLFPGAPIVYCRRDALDTCVSIYATSFGPGHEYATDLAAIALEYRACERLMRHWRDGLGIEVTEVVYEHVVRDPEGEARRIVAACGLAWDDACLRFHESGRVARTASQDQVRRPIYDSSIGRWKRFEKHLGPLRKALEASGEDVGGGG